MNKVPSCNIVLLVAWSLKGEKFWLEKELENIGFKVTTLDISNFNPKNRVIKWREILLWIGHLKLAWRGIQLARQTESIIVAHYFLVGIFASLLSAPILSKKRLPVIALNMIARNKGIVNQILRRLVYQTAFSSDRLLLTVNSPELREQYINTFGIRPKNIFVLRDCWWPELEVSLPNLNDNEFVFSGGEAARDWDTLLSVAEACPEIHFKVVARRMTWVPRKEVTSNVDVLFDTSEEEFYSLAASSRLVMLPLVGKVTAGLIVLIKSIFLGKMVITTDTPATAPYYPNDCHDLLVSESDVETMICKLKYYWINHENRIQKARKVQNYVLHDFSPEVYAKQVSNLIKNFFPEDKKFPEYEITKN